MKYRNAALVTLVLSAAMMVGPGIERGNVNLGPINAYAAEITNTWDSGNTTVTLDSEGTLTVTAKSGTDGRMDRVVYPDVPGWQTDDIRQKVNRIEVKEGVTYIVNGAFTKFRNPDGVDIDIAETVTEIGNSAFQDTFFKTVNVRGNVKFGSRVFFIDYGDEKTWGPNGKVINIYGDVDFNSSCFVDANSTLDGRANSQSLNCRINYMEGVENVLIPAAKYVSIPSTTKRLKVRFERNQYNSYSCSLILNGDVEIVYAGDKVFNEVTLNQTNGSIKFSKNMEYIGIDTFYYYFKSDKEFYSIDSMAEGVFENFAYNVKIDNIKNIPKNAFKNASGKIEVNWDTVESVGESAFASVSDIGVDSLTLKNIALGNSIFTGNNSVKELIIGNANHANGTFGGMTSLEKIVLLPEYTHGVIAVANCTKLESIYWLGTISPNQTKSMIPSTTTIYCEANSPVETWCKNSSVAYKTLTDEEVDGIINGKLPTLRQDSFMYDGTVKKDISLTVTLGEKPAGASGISKVLIDNEQLSQESWEFNGTDKIIIFNDELAKLTNGGHTISVLFDNDTFRSGATITVINSTHGNGSTEPPDALTTITYEFYKDYPDYVIIPVKLNGATEITRLRIGSNELTESDYKLEDGAIILDKDYVTGLEVGKYRVLPTFNDKDNTTIPNIMLRVYEKAADRAAPYLLQTRLVFSGQPIVLNFDPGEGDLQASNVLALVLDDEVILPNGERLPFSKTNTTRIKEAYQLSLEVDKPYIIDPEEEKEVTVATPSDVTKEEDTIEPYKATPSEATPKDEVTEEETDTEEDSDTEEEIDVATPSEAKQTKGLIDKAEATQEEKERLINIMAELEYSSDNVFTVEGTTVTFDGDYIKSLNLSAGDHLIGAIFDNTERTTDVKKVILTIPDNGNNTPDPDIKPDPTPDEKPDIKPTPNPTPDTGGNSGGNGGSSGGSGSGSKPSGNGNGSNNSSNIPDTGGNWQGSGDDWTYIKPDGNTAHSEWVGDGNNWYYIDENGKLKFDWFQDPATGIWYMLNRDHNGTFGAALKGWYFEKQDNKWYYLSTINNKMLTGWQLINGEWYYLTAFNEGPTYFGDNINGWKFDTTKGQRPYGSLWVSETTPDGYKVNETGVWIK